MVASPFQSLVVPTIFIVFVPLELVSTLTVLPETERPAPTYSNDIVRGHSSSDTEIIELIAVSVTATYVASDQL